MDRSSGMKIPDYNSRSIKDKNKSTYSIDFVSLRLDLVVAKSNLVPLVVDGRLHPHHHLDVAWQRCMETRLENVMGSGG